MDVVEGYSEVKFRRAMANSKMLSSDVSAAFDPLYAASFEKKNSAFFAHGLVFNKYTGSGGKGGSNDATQNMLQNFARSWMTTTLHSRQQNSVQ